MPNETAKRLANTFIFFLVNTPVFMHFYKKVRHGLLAIYFTAVPVKGFNKKNYENH
jgi:hypothetical protein